MSYELFAVRSASLLLSWYSSTVDPIHSAPSVQTSFFQIGTISFTRSMA